MIAEIATAAVMYFSDQAWAADTDLPVIVPALTCRYRDPQKMRQCLAAKMQDQPDPYAQMWDSDWVSSIRPIPEDSVAKKPQSPKNLKKPLTTTE